VNEPSGAASISIDARALRRKRPIPMAFAFQDFVLSVLRFVRPGEIDGSTVHHASRAAGGSMP
jgi:hypothetical protein